MATKQKIPQFQLERKFTSGYLDKIARFEMPEGAAQSGSYNFILNEEGKWASRWGTKFLGTRSIDTGGCRNSAVLIRRDGVEIPVIQYGTKVKYLHPTTKDWAILLTGLSPTATMGFAPGDLTSDNFNALVLSNGVDPYQYWNGATSTVASSTTTTITLAETNTLAELGFSVIGSVVSADGTVFAYQGINKGALVASATTTSITVSGNLDLATLGFDPSGSLKINELTYTYTSISGNDFLGVTPDPTQVNSLIVNSITADSIRVQGPAIYNLNFLGSGSLIINGVTFTYTQPNVQSSTINSITINGAVDLATLGYNNSGHINVHGVTFAYTGAAGETFTGVSPDPTPFAVPGDAVFSTNGDAAGVTFRSVSPSPFANNIQTGNVIVATNVSPKDIISQTGSSPILLGVTPDASGLAVGIGVANTTIVPDPGKTHKGSVLAATQYGRIVMGDVIKSGGIYGNGSLYISAVDSFTDFLFSIPRVSGEGAIINAPNGGGVCKGIQPYENGFVVAKDRVIYSLTIQDGNTIPFQLGILVGSEGSISPLCFFPSESTVNYVTADFTISSLQRVAQYDQFSHPLPISDPIKNTVDNLFFDATTAGKYYDGIDLYAMKLTSDSPLNNTILSYNKRYSCWTTPWNGLSASSFFIYGSDVYMCDAGTPDVYLMGSESVRLYTDFQTHDDPGFLIPGTLKLRNNDYGVPAIKKEFTEYWVEGEMFLTGQVTFSCIFDDGSEVISGVLQGTETGLQYTPTGGFGSSAFAVESFGDGSQGSEDMTSPIRFKLILTSEIQSFYEIAFQIESTGYFKLLTHGPKLIISSEIPDDTIYQPLR